MGVVLLTSSLLLGAAAPASAQAGPTANRVSPELRDADVQNGTTGGAANDVPAEGQALPPSSASTVGDHSTVASANDDALSSVVPPSPTLATSTAATARAAPNDPVRTLGQFGIGLGILGVLVGSIASITAVVRKNELDQSGCNEGHCPKAQVPTVANYNSARTFATIGYSVAVLGLASGSILLLIAPSRHAASDSPRLVSEHRVEAIWVGTSGTF